MTDDTPKTATVMALVDRVIATRGALRIAHEAQRAALVALRAAETVSDDASREYQSAQNALVVAAGGTDRSFAFDLTPLFNHTTLKAMEPTHG